MEIQSIAYLYLYKNASPSPREDAQWLWDGNDDISTVNQERQNTIYTQSAVLIEADPHLWEHLPPGASDLLDKVETIKK